MSIAQQRDEQRVDKMFLTYNHPIHTRHQIRNKCALLLNFYVQFLNVDSFCHNNSLLFDFKLWAKLQYSA